MSQRRIAWMDGIRFFAMGWVLFVHFVSVFTPNTNVRFQGIWGSLLFGITGKLAVACFCVLLGFFASNPSSHTRKTVPYCLRRWAFFAFQIFLIELLYWLAACLLPNNTYLDHCWPDASAPFSFVFPILLSDSVFFSAKIIPTYWCVDDFVIASIVIFCLSKLVNSRPAWLQLLVCTCAFGIALLVGRLWVAICLMGWFLRFWFDAPLPRAARHPIVLVALAAFLPWLIRRGECDLTYLLDGVACCIVFYIVHCSGWLQKILSLRPFVLLGSYTFELFLLHIPLYVILESILEIIGIAWPPLWATLLLGAAVFAGVVLCAVLWRKAMQKTLFALLDRQQPT